MAWYLVKHRDFTSTLPLTRFQRKLCVLQHPGLYQVLIPSSRFPSVHHVLHVSL